MEYLANIDKIKSKLKSCDFYRIFVENSQSEVLIAKEGKIDSVNQNEHFGLSIFYTVGKFGYFYSTNDPESLNKFKPDLALKKYSNLDYKPMESGIKDKKIIGKKSNLNLEDVAKELSKVTKLKKPFVSHYTDFRNFETDRTIICENTDINVKTHYGFTVNEVIAKENNTIRRTRKRDGFATALNDYFYEFISQNENTEEETIAKLKYKEGISGTYDVILDPELTGLLAHEAIGHACEADIVYKKQSVLANKLEKKLAPDFVNLIDDPNPTSRNLYGSLIYDDEGFKAKNKYLIKNGKLNEYITSSRYSQLMHQNNNGGARCESFNYLPIPRMTNTQFKSGNKTYDELVKEMKNGLVLEGSFGGQVNTALGTYQFGVCNAKIIENGKMINTRVNLSFSGNVLESLKNISEISKSNSETGPGFCGKDNQTAYVTCFGPHMLIKNVRLG